MASSMGRSVKTSGTFAIRHRYDIVLRTVHQKYGFVELIHVVIARFNGNELLG